MPPPGEVLLYVPNLIGYGRLAAIIYGFHGDGVFDSAPLTFLLLYALNMALDGIDGAAARRLNQTSAFGAWLDVVVDNLGRTLLWCRVAPAVGPWICCLEWTTFSCTHTLGAGWKMDFGSAPGIVMRVMANGFYTALGVWAIAGLHCLPLLIYSQSHTAEILQAAPAPFQPFAGSAEGLAVVTEVLEYGWWVLAAGRALVAAVELWFVWSHIRWLCEGSDEEEKKK